MFRVRRRSHHIEWHGIVEVEINRVRDSLFGNDLGDVPDKIAVRVEDSNTAIIFNVVFYEMEKGSRLALPCSARNKDMLVADSKGIEIKPIICGEDVRSGVAPF